MCNLFARGYIGQVDTVDLTYYKYARSAEPPAPSLPECRRRPDDIDSFAGSILDADAFSVAIADMEDLRGRHIREGA
jgi:hypothetical protein